VFSRVLIATKSPAGRGAQKTPGARLAADLENSDLLMYTGQARLVFCQITTHSVFRSTQIRVLQKTGRDMIRRPAVRGLIRLSPFCPLLHSDWMPGNRRVARIVDAIALWDTTEVGAWLDLLTREGLLARVLMRSGKGMYRRTGDSGRLDCCAFGPSSEGGSTNPVR